MWGDSVFLTGADEQHREVYCFDAESGTLRWKWPGPRRKRAEPLEISEDTGYAAATGATDGVRVFAMFAHGDLVALDFGEASLASGFGRAQEFYGHASSPVVAEVG